MDSELLKISNDLVDALNNQDKEALLKNKYKFLYYARNLFEVIPNYLALEKTGIHFDFGKEVLAKGSKLYRIRHFETNTNFQNPDEWSAPPLRPENRCNKEGEKALYLGTTETLCLLESHIKENEKYVLGEYIVDEDIELGGFILPENHSSPYYIKAGIILNAFLIAPSRCDKNRQLFDFLDSFYGDLKLNDLQEDCIEKIDLPFKFGKINNKSELYKITNKFISPIKEKYHDGISYSSCYIPIGTVGIKCSDHNICLYESGIQKIKFVKSEVKTNNNKFNEIEFAKVLLKIPPYDKQ